MYDSLRKEFYSNKDCTKRWSLRFFGKSGPKELAGSLPALRTWTWQGTELEHAMLGRRRQGLFLARLPAHLIFLGSEENQIFLYGERLCPCWAGFSALLRSRFSRKSLGPAGTFQVNFSEPAARVNGIVVWKSAGFWNGSHRRCCRCTYSCSNLKTACS